MIQAIVIPKRQSKDMMKGERIQISLPILQSWRVPVALSKSTEFTGTPSLSPSTLSSWGPDSKSRGAPL